ncbi:hypothetical protein SacmaDRAFT_2653 [Saccharomonospora marina XMU15]|uniref:Uncharacterized protein n=1 Tax=Saccharomonospora marina XMU15 TaxID=882083 RepID=H5X1N1_9PSEU|nr:hypothetical protein [Saccharomonospora marina]EHR50894.1 hypothetical protein SacmaDRAFT_2653 [Saccharomonospora marina XMU15]
MSALPAFATRLCDDAAVFPPGMMPLAEAVPAHAAHRAARYGGLVGPLVVAAPALAQLQTLLGRDQLELAVTAPEGPGQAAAAVAASAKLPVRLRALEIAVPPELELARLPSVLREARLDTAWSDDVGAEVFLEIPRDARRDGVLAVCAERGWKAKFRTGGVRAELHPGEAELASAVVAAVRAGVPFKATAGLHHAIRNTDPETGFEQHGFLNLLLATDAAAHGADEQRVVAVLADRDAAAVAAGVRALGEARGMAVRELFVSFGTCSITEPIAELVALGLLPGSILSEGVSA